MPRNRNNTGCATVRPAFTLAELIVVAVISVFVAGAVATSMSQLLRTRAGSAARQSAFARADAVAADVASEVANIARSADLRHTRVRIVTAGVPGQMRGDLLLISRSMRALREERAEGAEGGEYEVQFRIAPSSRGGEAFWKRVDAAFDEFQDAGGIARVLAPGAVSLAFQAYDGEAWYNTWESDRDGMPHAIRVDVSAVSHDGAVTAVSRRVVAIDRVPLMPVDMNPDGEDATTTPRQPTSEQQGDGQQQPATGGDRSGGAGGGGSGGGGPPRATPPQQQPPRAPAGGGPSQTPRQPAAGSPPANSPGVPRQPTTPRGGGGGGG